MIIRPLCFVIFNCTKKTSQLFTGLKRLVSLTDNGYVCRRCRVRLRVSAKNYSSGAMITITCPHCKISYPRLITRTDHLY